MKSLSFCNGTRLDGRNSTSDSMNSVGIQKYLFIMLKELKRKVSIKQLPTSNVKVNIRTRSSSGLWGQ